MRFSFEFRVSSFESVKRQDNTRRTSSSERSASGVEGPCDSFAGQTMCVLKQPQVPRLGRRSASR